MAIGDIVLPSDGGGGVTELFHYYASGNQVLAVSPTVNILDFQTAQIANGNFASSTFTAPSNGTYIFRSNIAAQPSETALLQLIIAILPSTFIGFEQLVWDSSGSFLQRISYYTNPVVLTATQQIGVAATWGGVGTLTTNATNKGVGFSGYKLA